MPYDANGKAITQEEKYKRELWEAQHEKLLSKCNTAAIVLLGLLILMGFVSIIAGIVFLWMSGEIWKQCLSVAGGILFIILVIMSLVFARFEL